MHSLIKFLTVVVFIAVCGFLALLFYGAPLANPESDYCKNNVLNRVLNWSSGCFYTAYFEDEPQDEQIKFEHKKLTAFAENGGAIAHIRRYRSQFYTRFSEQLNVPVEDLVNIHRDFISTSPTSVSDVALFLKHLGENNETTQAQSWLNEFCMTYIPYSQPYVLMSLEAMMAAHKVDLSTKLCREKLGIKTVS